MGQSDLVFLKPSKGTVLVRFQAADAFSGRARPGGEVGGAGVGGQGPWPLGVPRAGGGSEPPDPVLSVARAHVLAFFLRRLQRSFDYQKVL